MKSVGVYDEATDYNSLYDLIGEREALNIANIFASHISDS